MEGKEKDGLSTLCMLLIGTILLAVARVSPTCMVVGLSNETLKDRHTKRTNPG